MRRGKLSYRCSICQHKERLAIDRLLVEGKTKASISREFGVSTDALANHETRHLSHQLVAAMQKKQAMEGFDLHERMEGLYFQAKEILDQAKGEGKHYLSLAAISEMRQACGLISKTAVDLYNLRIAELQIERERSGDAQRDREIEHEGKLAILTDAELEMLARLSDKVERQSREIIIADPPKEEFPINC